MSDKNGLSDSSKLLFCSFCGKNQNEVRRLIAGPSVYICDECVDLCNDIISEEAEASDADATSDKLPVPVEIKSILDDYVIGQEKSKRILSVKNTEVVAKHIKSFEDQEIIETKTPVSDIGHSYACLMNEDYMKLLPSPTERNTLVSIIMHGTASHHKSTDKYGIIKDYQSIFILIFS